MYSMGVCHAWRVCVWYSSCICVVPRRRCDVHMLKVARRAPVARAKREPVVEIVSRERQWRIPSAMAVHWVSAVRTYFAP